MINILKLIMLDYTQNIVTYRADKLIILILIINMICIYIYIDIDTYIDILIIYIYKIDRIIKFKFFDIDIKDN